MKSIIAICLFLALLGLAAAAAPSTPTWPKAFSATLIIWNVSNPQQGPEFVRWFQDLPQNKSRRDQVAEFDPKVPPAWIKIIVNGTSATERLVYELSDGQVGCLQRPFRRHLINPDFSQFTYSGQVIINYNVLNQWNVRANSSSAFFSYFEYSSSREPYRFRSFDSYGNEEIINFGEFDAAPQDPNLFVIQPIIAQICGSGPNTFSNEMLVKQKIIKN